MVQSPLDVYLADTSDKKVNSNQHWMNSLFVFDSSDQAGLLCPQILHHIHAVTGVRVPYLPHGPLPDVLQQVPTSDWEPLDHTPWWLDSSFVVGYVSSNTRPIRVMNVLTKQETTIEVRACWSRLSVTVQLFALSTAHIPPNSNYPPNTLRALLFAKTLITVNIVYNFGFLE